MLSSTSKADDVSAVLEEEELVEALAKWPKRLVQGCRKTWSQLTIQEISGSFGDLGTLIPLYIALVRQDVIYAGPALFFAGLANVITGYSWDVPMCVQPMKSISAVAIAEGLSRQQVTAAGICMGVLMLFLGLTNFIEWVNIIVPDSVVSGIQVGVGINLAIHGLTMIQNLVWIDTRSGDCILLAIICSIVSLYLLRYNNSVTNTNASQQQQKQAPLGLYLFLIGAILAIIDVIRGDNNNEKESVVDDDNHFLQLGQSIATWALTNVTWADWKTGLLEGALPQLPLSTVNSVVSVCALAHTLYPEKRRHTRANTTHHNNAVVSRREVCVSVGWINLLFVPLGGMPNCHGAGGLAGQHRLGARHGASVVFLGCTKMLLALLFGGSFLLVLLDALPSSILGIMLLLSGHELATTGFTFLVKSIYRSSEDTMDRMRKSTVIMVLTVVMLIGFKKVHYAAITGWIAHMIYGDGFTDLLQQRNKTNGVDDGGDRDEPSQGYDSLLQQLEEENDEDSKNDSQACEMGKVETSGR